MDGPSSLRIAAEMMRQLADELIYRTTGDGRSELVLVKKGVREAR